MYADSPHHVQEELIHRRLGELIEEEQALEQRLACPLEPRRLEELSAGLDDCWALLSLRNDRTR